MFKIKRKIFSSLSVFILSLNLFLPPLVLNNEATPLPPVPESVQNLNVELVSYPDKKIVISLSEESLTAYDGETIFLQTPVTTGGQGTPTPVGTYKVISKIQNFVMRSPWPRSDWRWYSSVFVRYGLEFDEDGYYIHDAAWRNNFGPGSNSQRGTPGGDFTGTHGCVNVPVAAEAKLYAWAPVGTTVIVQP